MTTDSTTTVPASRKGEETRARILLVAADLIRRQGYTNTGIQEIVTASGVPKGSFYFYFASKEELGRALIRREWEGFRDRLQSHAFPPEGAVLLQFEMFFSQAAREGAEKGCQGGCLFGNLAAEVSDVHESLRREIATCFMELGSVFNEALRRGQRTGELKDDFEAEAASDFLIAVLEGSILLAKAQRAPTSLEHNSRMVQRFLDTLANVAPRNASSGGGIR